MAGEAPRYGAFAVQYGVGNEQEVARRSQSWRLRIVGAASTMLVGVVCIASIISPQVGLPDASPCSELDAVSNVERCTSACEALL